MQSALTGKVSTSAEGDAEVFAEHFGALYGKNPEYDLAVLELIKQREVRLDLDGEPTAVEIAKAVKALKVSGPGCTGVSAAEWKALLSDDETTAWVEEYVRRFWSCKVQPGEWEDGGLKILEKSGDLSNPSTNLHSPWGRVVKTPLCRMHVH
jgi:hypothetical protein